MLTTTVRDTTASPAGSRLQRIARSDGDLNAELHPEYAYYSFAKWLYHTDRVALVKEGAFREVLPVTAQLIPTLGCNFRCPRCSYGQAKEDIKALGHSNMMHMDEATMVRVIDRLHEAGVKAVVFTGGGEPTLNPGARSPEQGREHILALKLGALPAEMLARAREWFARAD